jgi:alginate O-acetyltransferase complex protein AlgI
MMYRQPARKKLWLVLSLCGNVGALATFKYLGFATQTLNACLGLAGAAYRLPVYNLILPVGISFYTFESLTYTVDIYRGHFRPTYSILKFFSFLSLFPHLVAGPILRPYDLMPQLEADKDPTSAQVRDGLKLIAQGFFKKMVIADQLAPLVNSAFAAHRPLAAAPYWWVITTMFAFQIYCDFSGYTDIARGLAKWMGYEFPLNFNHPYVSSSLREYWTRWHISLSSWFRDYVYIPLGGSRKSRAASHWNMWITMTVSGLWHGAAAHFLAWGVLHALWVSFERVTDYPRRLAKLPGGRLLSSAIALILVWVAWVLFRAPDMTAAGHILGIMFNPHLWGGKEGLAGTLKELPVLALAVVWELWYFFRLDHVAWERYRLVAYLEPVGIALMFAASIYLRGPGSAFIYFQF